MKLAYLSGCLALLMATTVMVTTVMAEDPLISLFDFTGAGAAREWQAVNDGVMGGVSETPRTSVDQQAQEQRESDFCWTIQRPQKSNTDCQFQSAIDSQKLRLS